MAPASGPEPSRSHVARPLCFSRACATERAVAVVLNDDDAMMVAGLSLFFRPEKLRVKDGLESP
jgi:hypothetical protein